MISRHKQVLVKSNGENFEVDEGVRQLVLLLNRFPGLHTLNSCQGGERSGAANPKGYVRVAGEGTTFFVCDYRQDPS